MGVVTRANIGRAVAGVSVLVLARDVVHVYTILRERAREEERYDLDPINPLRNPERHYGPDAESGQESNLVTDEEFQRKLAAQTVARASVEDDMVESYKDYLLVQRESAMHFTAGRAVFMQMAHPYVASGIVSHSKLKDGVIARFYRTLNNMFAMTFGSSEMALSASRNVRRLHQKVRGKLPEAVGMFPAGHVYNANNPHALLWVHITEMESSILGYELALGRLTEAQKDEIVRQGNDFARGYFGVPDHLLPADNAAMMREFYDVLRSGVIGVSDDARQIDSFIYKAPNFLQNILVAQTRWISMAMMPARLARDFDGRIFGTAERLVAALMLGLIRFFYRLIPKHARWVWAYVALRRRTNVPMSGLEQKAASVSASLTTEALTHLMPARVGETIARRAPKHSDPVHLAAV